MYHLSALEAVGTTSVRQSRAQIAFRIDSGPGDGPSENLVFVESGVQRGQGTRIRICSNLIR